MVRKVWLGVAAGLFLCAGLLLGTGSTATYAGDSRACGGPIVRAETTPAPAVDRGSQELARECQRNDDRQLVLAGVTALLGLAAGAAATSRTIERRPRPLQVGPGALADQRGGG